MHSYNHLFMPFEPNVQAAIVLEHRNILNICVSSGLADTWLLLPEIYTCLIFKPEMAYEEIADHLLNSSMGDVLETMVEFNYPNFTNLLYKFVADVVESSSKFPYDPAIYRGMYVFEARPVSRDHIAITFNV